MKKNTMPSTPVRKTKKCPKKRTYVVLKCAKVSTKKPVRKQGKVITMKCGIKSAARKYAMRVHRMFTYTVRER